MPARSVETAWCSGVMLKLCHLGVCVQLAKFLSADNVVASVLIVQHLKGTALTSHHHLHT